jgi:mono/diheme cytochrome c family protein
MNRIKLSMLVITAIIVVACNSTKKSSTSTTSSNSTVKATTTPAIATNTETPATPATPSSNMYLPMRPANGSVPPGNVELLAIQKQYSDVTMEKLKEGHAIYSAGACIKCHGTDNIYTYSEARWASIIDDMAQRANITPEQKDAVYKYVLSVKATQPK